jgi:hypothetical protein
MSSERETLRHLVEELSDDEVRRLLAVVRQRSAEPVPRRPSWIGALAEGPDFAKNAKETIRAELSGDR